MLREVALFKGNASGYLVLAHIRVTKNLFPFFDFGKGPTMSIITLEKGSSNAGIGLRGTGGITWFGFPTLWQRSHVLQYFVTSDVTPGQ